jgi:protein-S-isoprenylcysteine O-methyltransferase Ste14
MSFNDRPTPKAGRFSTVRSEVRRDLLFFGIPALLVLFCGLVVSQRDGYDGLVATMWGLVRHPENLRLLSAWNIAGLILCVVGLSIAITAVMTLKRFYSSTLVTRVDHQLIQHGLYRIVRHPIYLGALTTIMGVPVYAQSLYGFLTMSVLIPIVLNRIRMEERMLIEEFGDAYEVYRKATSKLIPFVY